MDNVRHQVHSAFKGLAEAVLPVRNVAGGFRSSGVLSPDEFVQAGDFLVATCPTWGWESGSRARQKPYLPPDKQYLVTRNVPCYTRAAAIESVESDSIVEAGGVGSSAADDGWLAPSLLRSGVALDTLPLDIPSMDPLSRHTTAEEQSLRCVSVDAEVPDMCDALAGASLQEDDECALPYLRACEPEDNILRTRTYDVSMSYDKFYQTPRIWLTGYDERRQLLTATQALEDVSLEHARKTVTVDAHPHTGVAAVSIHPCRHAAVMKSLGDQIARGGVEPQTEHFLLIFLRFCQTAMPTIDYDFTVNIGG